MKKTLFFAAVTYLCAACSTDTGKVKSKAVSVSSDSTCQAAADSTGVRHSEHTCVYYNLSASLDFKAIISRYALPDGFDSCRVELVIADRAAGKDLQRITYSSLYLFDPVFTNPDASRSYSTGKNAHSESMDNDFGNLVIADLNFDKKEDIAIIRDSGGNGGPLYDYYLQDGNGLFFRDSYLSDTMVFFPTRIDPKHRTLVTIVHANARQMSENTYRLSARTRAWKQVGQRFLE